MPLFNAKIPPPPKCAAPSSDIAAKIQRRRYQILVHSLIYYELDMNLIPDSTWSEWALELVALQNAHPDVAAEVIFADAFKDFDGSTGFNLPFKDEQIVNIAYRLLKASDIGNTAEALIQLQRLAYTTSEYSGFSKATPKQPIYNQRKAGKKVETAKRKKLF